MVTMDYLSYLVHEIHTTVVATTDENGLPVTCAIDMMDCDEDSLYFLTAKGKAFYERLSHSGAIALTGMKGGDTMSSVALSVCGKVREIGRDRLPALFEKNPYMKTIYPMEASRNALTVFQIYEGTGEWFDLSKQPIERDSFAFGAAKTTEEGYFVGANCIGCKLCYSRCPQKCIDITQKPVIIQQSNCLRCGNCYEICPVRAIEKRKA